MLLPEYGQLRSVGRPVRFDKAQQPSDTGQGNGITRRTGLRSFLALLGVGTGVIIANDACSTEIKNEHRDRLLQTTPVSVEDINKQMTQQGYYFGQTGLRTLVMGNYPFRGHAGGGDIELDDLGVVTLTAPVELGLAQYIGKIPTEARFVLTDSVLRDLQKNGNTSDADTESKKLKTDFLTRYAKELDLDDEDIEAAAKKDVYLAFRLKQPTSTSKP